MEKTVRNPGWTVQLAIHRAVRRDVLRLSAALNEAHDSSAAAVTAYWDKTAEQLHDHHVFEDSVIWPLMGERLGTRVSALLTRNAQEHHDMADTMNGFAAAVTALTTDCTAARAALRHMEEAIEIHLAHEEVDVLPLIPDAFTLEDIAFFSAQSAKGNPPEAFLPWVLDDATPADIAFFTGHLPEPLRAQLESEWLPQRLATIDALGLNIPVAPATSTRLAGGAPTAGGGR